MTELETLPESSVPSAFDRGTLYSPTLDLTRYALDTRYTYDYRPGDLYEPMPPAPRGNPKAFSWWASNTARASVPDFLGLRVGDHITLQHVTCTGPGEVIETQRGGAVVRYPMPKGSSKPYAETYVRRRNCSGYWY